MLVDIPDSLTCEAEHILLGGVAVLVEVPVWVLVVRVVTIPVLVVSVCILIVLEPSLVVSAS